MTEMRKVFDPNNIDPEKPGIIMMSHGGFAVGCMETMRMFMGDAPNVAAFSLEEGMEPEEFTKEAFAAYEAFPEGSLILLDLPGGTPYNQTLLYARSHPDADICAIGGFNLPMVIQALEFREQCRGRELVEKLYNFNNNGIVNVCETLDALRAKLAEK